MSDSDGGTDGSEEKVKLLKPKQLVQHQFLATKQCFDGTGRVLPESEELSALRAAADVCSFALESGDAQALRRAVHAGRSVAERLHSTGTRASGAEQPKKLWLQSWRPRVDPDREDPVSQVEPPKAPPPPVSAGAPEPENQQLQHKKDQADAKVRAAEHSEALRLYEELLEEPLERNRVAVLCNAALCALKVAPSQCRWPWVKHMLKLALKYSRAALEMEPTNVKAHFRRGCALEALERFREAYFAYASAFSLDPGDSLIRAAFDRVSRYDASELGDDLKAQIERAAKTSCKTRGRQKPTVSPRVAGQSAKTASPAGREGSTCCHCSGSCVGGDFLASPCGHGPFCGPCRRRVEEDGRGLRLCPICRGCDAPAQCVLISEWVSAETLKASEPASKSRRAFGPRRPPEMAREAARLQKTFPRRFEDPGPQPAAAESARFLELMD